MLASTDTLPHRPARRDVLHATLQLECFERGDAGRADIEAFIGAAFQSSYGARISHFSDTLVGCRDEDGDWCAALGYSLADAGPTFLEHYLDAPLELAIGAQLGHPVERARIVEVGNLAALQPGAARELIIGATGLLYRMGLHLVAFTATASLLNSFCRLHLTPRLLAPADPARLPDAGRQWGSYYATQPQVMFGDIRHGHEKLARISARARRSAQ